MCGETDEKKGEGEKWEREVKEAFLIEEREGENSHSRTGENAGEKISWKEVFLVSSPFGSVSPHLLFNSLGSGHAFFFHSQSLFLYSGRFPSQ